jgi:hypothetical protein
MDLKISDARKCWLRGLHFGRKVVHFWRYAGLSNIVYEERKDLVVGIVPIQRRFAHAVKKSQPGYLPCQSQ